MFLHTIGNSNRPIADFLALLAENGIRHIADQFLAQGWQVFDIISPHNTKPHELPEFAAVVNGRVTYPGNPRPLFDD